MNQPEILKEARHRIPVLVVCHKSSNSAQLRNVLLSIGFDQIATASSYANALSDAKSRPCSLVFFDAESPASADLNAAKFVQLMLKLLRNPVLIAVSYEPSGENLFSLLKLGTKGFLLPPFTAGALEEAFTQVQNGMEISEEVLQSSDRMETFASLIREDLDRLTTRLKGENLKKVNGRDLQDKISGFSGLVKMAKFFCDDKSSDFMSRVREHFLAYAAKFDDDAEKSRLRKTREMLRNKRMHKQ